MKTTAEQTLPKVIFNLQVSEGYNARARNYGFSTCVQSESWKEVENLMKKMSACRIGFSISYVCFRDLYGMIDLDGVSEMDEESGDLITYMKEQGVSISKVSGMGFGDHRFIGPQEALEYIARNWYAE